MSTTYRPRRTYNPLGQQNGDGITEKQQGYIERLLGDRLAALGQPDVATAVAALKVAELSKVGAGELIGRLLEITADADPMMPPVVAAAARQGVTQRPDRCVACKHAVPAGEGYWFTHMGGFAVHHKVGGCSTEVAVEPIIGSIYRTASGLVQVYRTQNGRPSGKMLNAAGKFVWVAGALGRIDSTSTLLEGDELAAVALSHAVAHSNCIFCAKELTDPASDPLQGGVGYGPVCANKYNLPHGNVRR